MEANQQAPAQDGKAQPSHDATFRYCGNPDVGRKDAFALVRELIEGNERWMSDAPERPNQCVGTKHELARGQNPEIIIVSCSDSRVAPEIIFDVGLGRVFPIRGAGNVVSSFDIASIEFAVASWKCPLLVVLGHEKCGAIGAALHGAKGDLCESPHVHGLLSEIRANISMHCDDPGKAPSANVMGVIDRIGGGSKIVADAVRDGGLAMLGGVYCLETRKVQFLS